MPAPVRPVRPVSRRKPVAEVESAGQDLHRPEEFRRTVWLVAAAHVAIIIGLFAWGIWHHPSPSSEIIWMSGGLMGTAGSAPEGDSPAAEPAMRAVKSDAAPEPEPEPELAPEVRPPEAVEKTSGSTGAE